MQVVLIALQPGHTALRHPIIQPRCSRPLACAAELPAVQKLRAAELQRRLQAAGVSTVGILEKEELVSLVLEHQLGGDQANAPTYHEASLVEQQGCAYAEVATRSGATVRLLVDTGASRSVLASAAVGGPLAGQHRASRRQRSNARRLGGSRSTVPWRLLCRLAWMAFSALMRCASSEPSISTGAAA